MKIGTCEIREVCDRKQKLSLLEVDTYSNMSCYDKAAVAEVLYRTPLLLPQPHTSMSSQKPVSSSEYFLFGTKGIASLVSWLGAIR